MSVQTPTPIPEFLRCSASDIKLVRSGPWSTGSTEHVSHPCTTSVSGCAERLLPQNRLIYACRELATQVRRPWKLCFLRPMWVRAACDERRTTSLSETS
jgi:hypothetical protein